MNCLVLGGGGFLGSHLTESLVAAGHAVRIFERPNLNRPRSAPQGVEWLEGDFLNLGDLSHALADCEIVYHLVSTTLPKDSNKNPAYDVETNVVGTLRFLELACRRGVRKVIFVSSGGTVYGLPQEVPLKETHVNHPTCSYGIGKLMIEKYLHLFHVLYGLNYCALRLANPYGERQRVTASQGAVTVFLYKALRDEVIEIWGDGSVVRDYIYVKDAIRALVCALDCETGWPVFNIGSGQGRSLNDVLAAIEALLDRPVCKTYLPGRAFDVPANVLDISKAAELLHWTPQVTFGDGLRKTCQWLREELGYRSTAGMVGGRLAG